MGYAGYYDRCRLILATTITPLHVGTGRYGVESLVDLPIQRDSFGVPCVWASSFKGALKSHLWTRYSCLDSPNDKYKIKCRLIEILFGPEIDSIGEKYAACISLVDLKMLSMIGPCTSGLCIYSSLNRLRLLKILLSIIKDMRDDISWYKNLYIAINEFLNSLSYEDEIKFIVSSQESMVENIGLVLPDGRTVTTGNIARGDDVKQVFREILVKAYDGLIENNLLNKLLNRIILVPNSLEKNILGYKLIQQVTRIALDYRTKTVKSGALWSEEYVPELTIFFGALFAGKPRKEDIVDKQKDHCLNILEDLLDKRDHLYLFLGGNETIGKGLIKIMII